MNQVVESLQGSVERVTFHSEESGFCVCRLKVRGHRDLIACVGSVASISAGEFVEAQGVWVNDAQHGMQFRASSIKTTAPNTLEGMQKYLGSGMIKGIGPHFAKRLIKAFGDSVFDVIEKEPERLLKLEGIGKKRKKVIVDAWDEQKAVRDIMVFLQSHGVGTARAVRIYKIYGDYAIKSIQENPYRLARDIRGIGFKSADQIAHNMGIERNSLIRAQAGVCHVLQTLCDNGHCAAFRGELISESSKLLEISGEIIEEALCCEIKEKNLIEEIIDGSPCVFLASLHRAEVNACKQLNRLTKLPVPWGKYDFEKAIEWVEKKNKFKCSDSQREAIKVILSEKISIMTGGPGVGKTTLVKCVLTLLRAKKMQVMLCAPTGRAAKRLSETTGMPAKTIHRLLDFDPSTRGFKHNLEQPLLTDVVIVDESSMLDITLFQNLLKAIPDSAAVIFVGDVDQLPSVGSGAVLADLIKSNAIAVVRLTEIFRQAADSQIILNSHKVNSGEMPLQPGAVNLEKDDFFTLYYDDPETIQKRLVQVVSERLPKRYGWDPIRDIQVLAPMKRGGLGCHALNAELQKKLNGSSEPKLSRFGTTFAPGDKIIQMQNNYDKDIFNGDIGVIDTIDTTAKEMLIRFDQKLVTYDFNECDEIQLAYAISIHKSQGSEFPVVVIPIAMQHYMLLARNLLYTALTRGKKMVILIGQKKAVGMAVRQASGVERLTNLAQRLVG